VTEDDPQSSAVLVVTYYYPPDMASGAARPHRLTKYLRRLGHDVVVLSSRKASDPIDQDPRVHRVLTEGEGQELAGVTGFVERWFRRGLFNQDPGTLWATRVMRSAPSLFPQAERPVMISTAPPFTVHLAALAMKLRYKWPWIADFRDPLAGNPFRITFTTIWTDAYFERLIMRHADAVIANTSAVAEMWRQRYPQWKSKIHVVWNGFDPENAPAALPARGTPMVLTHVGVIYGDRNPLPIVSALGSLIEAGHLDPKNFRVQLYGPLQVAETAMSKLESISRQGWLDIRNETIPKIEAAKLTAEADYLLLLDVLGNQAGLQVPAKLFEYICIGRPILASTTAGSAVMHILTKAGIPHLCFTGEQSDAAKQSLIDFFSLPTTPTPPSDWFQTEFNAENQAAFLSRMVRDLHCRV
jgi:glycosyltransferase involved in cell wall biosynthesis